MELYVTDRSVLVEDGGEDALPLLHTLLREGARVTVAASTVCAAVQDLAERGLLTWESARASGESAGPYDLVVGAAAVRRPAPDPAGGADADTAAVDPRPGLVTLVGAGPGDPELITVAGRAAIERADVILADRLAPWEAAAWARPDAELIDVAKIPYGRSTSQEEINRLLVEHARAGRRVVRLKGGDPFVFGRGFEELLACAAADVPTRVVPGVTSSVAGPEAAGIPVTHRGLVQGFTVVSGHLPPDHPDCTLDYAALARAGTTLVVLMGMRRLPEIVKSLVAAGVDRTTPCAVVADATLAAQRTVRSTLGEVVADADAAGLRAPTVTIIGAVAGLAS
ncbi:uroporphyrinogen-III C-methyltransferase [Streptomyces oceani]|uniref:uroporphyrinogen-III C-methyltransferase n=1 Tax=Streptomyces oceani TaxID=1075402 RepID=A0A1E7JX16_9ACTN|nr:uroporphyrinogen-III C-methyltransferase [Streptomyces oceani]OEU96213.1 uroporphyrin-III methyltransferase [Streptomyces oceani]